MIASGGGLRTGGGRGLQVTALPLFLGVLLLSDLLVVLDPPLPLAAVGGIWVSILGPAWVIYSKLRFGGVPGPQRVVLSVILAVTQLVLVGLVLNFGMAPIGVLQPLGRVPLLVSMNAVALALLAIRYQPLRLGFSRPSSSSAGLLLLAGFTLPLSVAGAVRLNNGASGAVALVMLGVVGLVMVRVLVIRNAVSEAVICGALYLVSVSLLLMTSLRGWFVTGHDIQREFQVFQLTRAQGVWVPDRLHDAFNACLSITVLPTELAELTRVPDIYVFKVLFQVLFALCPVLVYLVSRRFTSRGISLVATFYFLAFPTFFSDMPFLNRQEIALLLLGAALVMIVEPNLDRRRARAWLMLFLAALVPMHYSTSYVFAGVLGLTWLLLRSRRALSFARPAVWHLRQWATYAIRSRGGWAATWARSDGGSAGGATANSGLRYRVVQPPAVTLASVLLVVALSLVWYGPLTQTDSGLARTVVQATQTLLGRQAAARSSDVGYGLLGAATPNDQARLDAYRARTWTLRTTPGQPPGSFYPESVVDRRTTPVMTEVSMPLTAVGRAFEQAHLPVVWMNSALRILIAKMLQVFVLIGLLLVIMRRARSLIWATAEFTCLAASSCAILAMVVLAPALSAQYGVLRVFQQSLFVLAPFVAVGSVSLLRPLKTWAPGAGAALAVMVFASTSGLLPQVTGGYPPQLNLNNAGLYYDLYYVNTQESVGMRWLRGHASTGTVQEEIQNERFAGARPDPALGPSVRDDIYPTLLRTQSFVFLGSNTVRRDLATVSMAGDPVSYRYPMSFLEQVKSLVYSNGDAEIFR